MFVAKSDKLILINGPKRVGKDTLGQALYQEISNAMLFEFAYPVKRGTHAAFGLDVPVDHYENCKDEPHSDFFGMTPRKAWIDHAEKYMRKEYGRDVYVKILLNRITRIRMNRNATHTNVWIVTDTRFKEEVKGMSEAIGAKNTLIIQVHREGYDFTKDVGAYQQYGGIKCAELWNVEGNPAKYIDEAKKLVGEWLKL